MKAYKINNKKITEEGNVMQVIKCIEQYIDGIQDRIPIFTNDIYDYVTKFFPNVKKQVLNEYISRYLRSHSNFVRFQKGIYYKTKITPFGKAGISYPDLIRRIYLMDNDKVIGYETGPSYMNKIGLTTQMPAYTYLATERVRHELAGLDSKLILLKPKIAITKDNCRYLQFLDIIENSRVVSIETNYYVKIMRDYIVRHSLNFEQLLYYARFYNNNQIYTNIAMLAKGK